MHCDLLADKTARPAMEAAVEPLLPLVRAFFRSPPPQVVLQKPCACL